MARHIRALSSRLKRYGIRMAIVPTTNTFVEAREWRYGVGVQSADWLNAKILLWARNPPAACTSYFPDLDYTRSVCFSNRYIRIYIEALAFSTGIDCRWYCWIACWTALAIIAWTAEDGIISAWVGWPAPGWVTPGRATPGWVNPA